MLQALKKYSTKRKFIIILFFAFSLMLNFGGSQWAVAADFAGSLKSVKLSGPATSNTPPSVVLNYTDKGNNLFDFDANGTSDADGTIAQYKWDFGDGTNLSGPTASHQFASAGKYPVTLTVFDNGGGVSIQQTIINLISAVSFQPETSAVVNGYTTDSGLPYDATRGYGWTVAPASYGVKDSNVLASPDNSYDTYIHVSKTGVWEFFLPDGEYNVRVCIGEPKGWTKGNQYVQVEGTPLFENSTTDATNPWLEKSLPVTVSDGKLTLTFKNTVITYLCWVKISPKGA